jgi:hypothetical protein
LTTKEFFQEVDRHLSPDGVIAINVGRTPFDRSLIEAMVGTLGSVFPSVHVVDVPNTFNTLIFGTVQPTNLENLVANELHLRGEGASWVILNVLERAIENVQITPYSETVFTDDRAPIELLTNAIVMRFILSGEMGVLR